MNMWDERYSEMEYAYGEMPNDWLVECAKNLAPNSNVLCIADGQGRNGVYLATLGHNVTTMDGSSVAIECSKKFADKNNVKIEAIHADLNDFDMGENKWDAIVSIFVHLDPEMRKTIHANIVKGLKKGGQIILEAYYPEHLKMAGIGGPKDVNLLFTPDMLKEDFEGFEFHFNTHIIRDIQEGKLHEGVSSVVQLHATK